MRLFVRPWVEYTRLDKRWNADIHKKLTVDNIADEITVYTYKKTVWRQETEESVQLGMRLLQHMATAKAAIKMGL
jgi:hypothetical protein